MGVMAPGAETRTAEQRLDRLESIHAIRQLPYRYALAFDSRDRNAFLALWAPVDAPAAFPDIDGATVAARIDHFFRHGPSVMFVGNHVIEFDDDDHARGSVYAWPQVAMAEGFVDQIVLYEDRYVRVDGCWLFAVRRHLLIYGQRRAEDPFSLPAANWPAGQVGRGVVR
jgi:SnoaL-like domain